MTTLGILFAAIALIIISVAFGANFVAGGGGVVLTVGLIYSFVVTKREIERGDQAAAQAAQPAD
jgi:drug/metabolite transporter superfamily protein YnfA